MRFVMRTGEKTLQQAGPGQTDDRGMYRIFGCSRASNRERGAAQRQAGDLRRRWRPRSNPAAAGAGRRRAPGALGGGAGGGGRGGGGRGGRRGGHRRTSSTGGGGGRGQQPRSSAALQQQPQQQDQQQTAPRAGVLPGHEPAAAADGHARGRRRARRRRLPVAARADGAVRARSQPDGTSPGRATLARADGQGPTVPGLNTNRTRVNQDGTSSSPTSRPGSTPDGARGDSPPINPTEAVTQQQRRTRHRRGTGPGDAAARAGRGGGRSSRCCGLGRRDRRGQNMNSRSTCSRA